MEHQEFVRLSKRIQADYNRIHRRDCWVFAAVTVVLIVLAVMVLAACQAPQRWQ